MVFLKYKRERRRRNYKARGVTNMEKLDEIVRVLRERERYMLGVWVWVGVGVSNKEIERVYEYYKYGRDIGYIEKRKSSVKEMRESNISKNPVKEVSSCPFKEVSSEVSSKVSSCPFKEVSSEYSSKVFSKVSSCPFKEVSSEYSSEVYSKVSSCPFKEVSSEYSSEVYSEDLSTKIFTEEEQLKYIMPKEILKEMGIEKDWDEEVSYEWAYCDYFWEADVIVTRIPLNKK